MLRNLLFIFLVVVLFDVSFAQEKSFNEKRKDSLIRLISKYKKLDRLGEVPFLSRAERISKKQDVNSLKVVLANRIFYHNLSKKDFIKSKESLNGLLTLYRKQNNLYAYGNYFFLKGDFFSTKNKVDSAYVNYVKAKNIFKKHKFSLDACDAYKSILITQFVSKDRIGLEQTAIEAEKFLLHNKAYHHLCSMNMYIAFNEGNHNLKIAEKYFERALQFADSINNKKARSFLRSGIMINYSYTYLMNKKYQLAIEKADEGLLDYNTSEIREKLLYNKIGFLVNKGKSLLDSGNTKEGLKIVNEAHSISKKNNLSLPIGFTNNVLAGHYNNQKQYQKAIPYAEESLKIFTANNILDGKLLSLKHLAKAYEGKKSKYVYEKYITLKDSINKNQLKTKEQFALVRFETEKKEAENLYLKQQNILSNSELISEKRRSRNLQLLAIIGVILLVSLILIHTIRKKNIEFKANLAKAEAREQERKKIAINLHDKVVGDLRAVYQKAVKNKSEEIIEPLLTIKEEIRNLSHKLSSVDFDEVSFKDQILNTASDYFEPNFRIKIQNINHINWATVNKEIKRALFLVAREAIQNSKKHGKATQVIITFNYQKKTVQLEIKDNGKGFNVSSPRFGIGLQNQKQRVEELKGTYNLMSELGVGTTTIVNIPLVA
jgi:signal transduction histidine kinase